jgi:hypothetical protein
VDGCYARAHFVADLIKNKFKAPVKKVFIFGDLQVSTPYTEEKMVTWWYHVAVLVKKNKKLYVFDPALDFQRPLLLTEWVAKQNVNTFQLSICDSQAYEPSDRCSGPSKYAKEALKDLQEYLLPSEWDQMNLLKEVNTAFPPADQILGNYPPWVRPFKWT